MLVVLKLRLKNNLKINHEPDKSISKKENKKEEQNNSTKCIKTEAINLILLAETGRRERDGASAQTTSNKRELKTISETETKALELWFYKRKNIQFSFKLATPKSQ